MKLRTEVAVIWITGTFQWPISASGPAQEAERWIDALELPQTGQP